MTQFMTHLMTQCVTQGIGLLGFQPCSLQWHSRCAGDDKHMLAPRNGGMLSLQRLKLLPPVCKPRGLFWRGFDREKGWEAFGLAFALSGTS